MNLKAAYLKARTLVSQVVRRQYHGEDDRLLLGRALAARVRSPEVRTLRDAEFKVFSQWGDDGIIQFLVSSLDIASEVFVEFGVEDYRESNTRFLMMNDNWSGLVMDGLPENVERIVQSEYFWKYDLKAKCAFVTRENVNDLLAHEGITGEIGLLHIDIDGNDYWVWEALDVVDPVIVVMEYNSVFGIERPISVPYQEGFVRGKAHFSNLYYGASLRAFAYLAGKKGYAFVGCNAAGNNAYFVRRGHLGARVREIGLEEGYVRSKFRESRDRRGNLTHLSGEDRLRAVKGMSVIDVITGTREAL